MSLEWIQNSRYGGRVNRVHAVPTITPQSVAEHTFNSILIAHEICQDVKADRHCEIDEAKVMQYILLHDVPEMYTGDIPAYIKKGGVKSLLEELEDVWRQEVMPDYHKNIEMDVVELGIASLVDSLELVMFCIDEFNMGNRDPLFLNMFEKGLKYAKEKHLAFCINPDISIEILDLGFKLLNGDK